MRDLTSLIGVVTTAFAKHIVSPHEIMRLQLNAMKSTLFGKQKTHSVHLSMTVCLFGALEDPFMIFPAAQLCLPENLTVSTLIINH
jgi:hypothetical protein